MQVAESSPAKQFLFKRSLQTAHRRRMLVEAEKPIGRALDLQHRLLDKVILGVQHTPRTREHVHRYTIYHTRFQAKCF